MLKVGVKKTLDYSRLLSVASHHWDLEFLISRWRVESHTFVVACAEVGLTLEDVMNLIALPLYRAKNVMGLVLQKVDEANDKV